MNVQMRQIESIRPYENNPRLNDAAVDAVAASILAFGFRQPIVVDEAGVIIVGHTRYKAALKLGLTEVPVHVAVGLSPARPGRTASPTTRRPRYRAGTTTSCRWSWPPCRSWGSTWT
jgi:ParB-like nuclease domain